MGVLEITFTTVNGEKCDFKFAVNAELKKKTTSCTYTGCDFIFFMCNKVMI